MVSWVVIWAHALLVSVLLLFPEHLAFMSTEKSPGPYEKVIQELEVNFWSRMAHPSSKTLLNVLPVGDTEVGHTGTA